MVALSSVSQTIQKIAPGKSSPKDGKAKAKKDKKDAKPGEPAKSPSAEQASAAAPVVLEPIATVRALYAAQLLPPQRSPQILALRLIVSPFRFEYNASDPDELSFKVGDLVSVIAMDDKDWWEGGRFQDHYVAP